MANCPKCDKNYKKLGNHWQHNPTHRPNLTDKQREILTGILMGDGCIVKRNTSPYMKVEMTTKSYLNYLDDTFGVLGTGVKFSKSAKTSAKNAKESGFVPNANAENFNDVYRWSTRSHPELQQYAEWYSSGEKIFPENIELTPTVLKHWYVCDGNYNTHNLQESISIGVCNELSNIDKINKYFSNVGLPEPSFVTYKSIGFTKQKTHTLFEYMGKPITGFEYKFPK
jgi:hypothetical protein